MRYYFAELVALIEGRDLFEVLATWTSRDRYWPKGAQPVPGRAIRGGYRVALRALAASGRVLELNTKSPPGVPST